jgi:hypothetical protein
MPENIVCDKPKEGFYFYEYISTIYGDQQKIPKNIR